MGHGSLTSFGVSSTSYEFSNFCIIYWLSFSWIFLRFSLQSILLFLVPIIVPTSSELPLNVNEVNQFPLAFLSRFCYSCRFCVFLLINVVLRFIWWIVTYLLYLNLSHLPAKTWWQVPLMLKYFYLGDMFVIHRPVDLTPRHQLYPYWTSHILFWPFLNWILLPSVPILFAVVPRPGRHWMYSFPPCPLWSISNDDCYYQYILS